jgi:hypothetical protein
MAFQEQEPVRSRIETENKIMEQLNSFNYLGNLMSYEKEMDIDNKMNNYLKITNNKQYVYTTETFKKTRLKLYSTLVLTRWLYSSQNWVIKARHTRRITAAEMKYIIKTAGYIWTDYKTNTEIAK